MVVSVVLITWNSAPFLRRCAEGIAAQRGVDLDVIVVDNASVDGSAELIEELLPTARILRNGENRGFSVAVNQALEIARGDFVLLCNPDALLAPDYAAVLVRALERAGERFGSATGTLYRAEGTEIRPTEVVDSKGVRMTRSGRHFDIGQGLLADAPVKGLRPLAGVDGAMEVFGVSGAAAMHRMSFLRAVGEGHEILDEDFFAFREDADLAWRGRLMGWRALYVPAAVGWHVRTVTPEVRRALPAFVNLHSVKNRFLLRLKNEGAWLALRNAPFELARDVVAIAAVLTVERSSLPALTWLWKNRRRILERRQRVQARRVVSDRELASWFD